MKKNILTALLSVILCLLLLPASVAETREGVIMLEGMEEPIEETLFESPLGFSFWYANEKMEAYHGEAGYIEGVVISALYSDDYMVLSMIPEEDAEEYTGDWEENIVELSADTRVQEDLYHVLEDGQYLFLTLIAEKGQYLCAVGQYSQEAAEGNAKYFQRILDSVTFTSACPIRAEWGNRTDDGSGLAQVILTALEPVEDVVLLKLDWEDFDVSWEEAAPLGSLSAQQSVSITLEFIGDMPNNGIQYTDEAGVIHAFALDISGEDGSLLLWKLEE